MKMPLFKVSEGRRTVGRGVLLGQGASLAAGVRSAGFTMIEIALSLGVLAFALVAIVGVLPSGMQVQRENREWTVLNQDAAYLMEAIKSGSRGVDDLTNYVESITVRRGNRTFVYTNDMFRPGGLIPITNGMHIVSLLSTPKYEWLPNGTKQLNSVRARMKTISGSAVEKSKSAVMKEFGLRYEVIAEVVPFAKNSIVTNFPPQTAQRFSGDARQWMNLGQNLYEVRLTMRWPLFLKGNTWDVGRYRRTVRTLVSGELLPVYTNSLPYQYIIEPYTFTSAQ